MNENIENTNYYCINMNNFPTAIKFNVKNNINNKWCCAHSFTEELFIYEKRKREKEREREKKESL
ncbi:hypothetical protein PIROE2DRAFT_19396 [Piromyces sp. E2]|nr:hypothetical protein PIROE2DRAFT_19396 [Piromyces sp. E2]|eukprot:OUM56138.1 hypothetical protein PIROE2DRAFT_19396 [Piromyces sp. E2]